ncbi:hypothetical protein VNO78_21102 [Psophocarpus tetragonolobus]|uniref:Uncharacterized protein n=1 Tax=Psophocarpus tetragonolobus TaxID=3891 RepID=A0AAN9SEL5_PSOTE
MFKSLCDKCSKGFPTWKDMDQPRVCDKCGLIYFSIRSSSPSLSARSLSAQLPTIDINRSPPHETHIHLNRPPPQETQEK